MSLVIPEGQVYLDNASTTYPKPECVNNAVAQAVKEVGLTVGRGKFYGKINPDEIVARTRVKLAKLFNAKDPHSIIFTYSATDGINLALFGLLHEGDEVLVSHLEHHAVSRALHYLKKNRSVNFCPIPSDENGRVIPEAIAGLVTERTRLICVNHVSNVSGTIQPLKEIGKVAGALGVPFMVDSAQSAGCLPIDVEEMNISILAAPGHKSLLGLPGSGVLYLADGVRPQPFRVGGTGKLSQLYDLPAEMPTFYESGTPNVLGIIALDAALDFIFDTGIDTIKAVGGEKHGRILEHLKSNSAFSIVGPKDKLFRCGPIAFNIEGQEPATIGTILAEHYHIANRAGLHCSPMTHEFFGTAERGGAVRVSPAYLTPNSEIDYFIEAIDELVTSL